jgi:signal transduction histidine kinase/CheY-like chemotaxis protein/HPt (histidine-containing phosphotransfer) domain-containing protein
VKRVAAPALWLGWLVGLLCLGAPAASADAAAGLGSDAGVLVWATASKAADLKTVWCFYPEDEPSLARPTPPSRPCEPRAWPTPFGFGSGAGTVGWYRLEVRFAHTEDWQRARRGDLSLAVSLGKVNSAYELFAGGERIGSVGQLGARARADYDRHEVSRIPASLVGEDGRLVLALRVWKDPATGPGAFGGPFEGSMLLGEHRDLLLRAVGTELPALFLVSFYLALALFHLEVFSLRGAERVQGWYAAMALQLALYFFLRSQWKYLLGDHFLLYKEVEHGLLYTLIASGIELIWPMLGFRLGRAVRLVQAACLVLGAVVAFGPGLRFNLIVLPLWQAALLVLAGVGIVGLARQAAQRHPDSWIIVLGTTLLGGLFAHDILVDRGWVDNPRLSLYGTLLLMLAIAVALARQSQRVRHELDQLRRDLERRVDERTQALFEANQTKTRFLATISHEIRSPLNGVLGMTQMLLSSELKPEQRQYAEIVRKSGDVLLSLIEDVLDFTRIEAGKVELERYPFVLRDCVEEAADILAGKAAEMDLDLALAIDPGLARRYLGDGLRLRQVLVNLIGNAVKFTHRGGVFVHVTEADEEGSAAGRRKLHVEVRDTGIGIDAASQQRIFDVFGQLDASHTRRYGGSGLGLAICRNLTEMMGGRIWVESELGKGSTFHCTVALEAIDGEEAEVWDEAASQFAGMTLLVVEAGEFSRQVLLGWLERWRVRAEVVANLEAALLRVREGARLDAVLIGLWGEEDNPLVQQRLAQLSAAVPTLICRRLRLGDGPRLARVPGLAGLLLAPIKPRDLALALTAARGNRGGVAAPVELGRQRVLLAEDDEVNRRVATWMLQQLGVEQVDLAVDGVATLEALTARPYDVLLLDIQMPGMDGLEAARRVRERTELLPQMPRIVAFTAHAALGDRERLLAAGMDDYLAKPLRIEALREVLERAARGARAEPAPLEVEGLGDDTVDRAVFDRLSLLDGGRNQARRELVTLFVSRSPQVRRTLTEALEAGDLETVHRLAHSLKSSAGVLGAKPLAEACAQLEEVARERAEVPALRAALAAVAAEQARAEAALAALSQDDGLAAPAS